MSQSLVSSLCTECFGINDKWRVAFIEKVIKGEPGFRVDELGGKTSAGSQELGPVQKHKAEAVAEFLFKRALAGGTPYTNPHPNNGGFLSIPSMVPICKRCQHLEPFREGPLVLASAPSSRLCFSACLLTVFVNQLPPPNASSRADPGFKAWAHPGHERTFQRKREVLVKQAMALLKCTRSGNPPNEAAKDKATKNKVVSPLRCLPTVFLAFDTSLPRIYKTCFVAAAANLSCHSLKLQHLTENIQVAYRSAWKPIADLANFVLALATQGEEEPAEEAPGKFTSQSAVDKQRVWTYLISGDSFAQAVSGRRGSGCIRGSKWCFGGTVSRRTLDH